MESLDARLMNAESRGSMKVKVLPQHPLEEEAGVDSHVEVVGMLVSCPCLRFLLLKRRISMATDYL